MISISVVPSIFVPGIYICSMVQEKATDLTVAILYCEQQWYTPILGDKCRRVVTQTPNARTAKALVFAHLSLSCPATMPVCVPAVCRYISAQLFLQSCTVSFSAGTSASWAARSLGDHRSVWRRCERGEHRVRKGSRQVYHVYWGLALCFQVVAASSKQTARFLPFIPLLPSKRRHAFPGTKTEQELRVCLFLTPD